MLEKSLSDEEIRLNNNQKQDLIDFIQSGEAILMAGAGCTGSLYPTWTKLMDEFEAAAIEHQPDFNGGDKGDYLGYANEVKHCLGEGRYYEIIRQCYEPAGKTHEQHHEILCSLPFRAITTTNYDVVLEYALSARLRQADNSLVFEGTTPGAIHKFLMSLNDSKSQKKVAHLHGKYDQPASIVLCGAEYEEKYGFSLNNPSNAFFDEVQGMTKEEFHTALIKFGYKWPLGRKLLWSLLATRRVVFIGFSLNDPYFEKMLDFIKEELGTYYSKSHFLVLRITEKSKADIHAKAKRLRNEFGIQTVFYFDEEGDYSGLARFISELNVKREVEPREIKIIQDETVKVAQSANNDDSNLEVLRAIKKQIRDED